MFVNHSFQTNSDAFDSAGLNADSPANLAESLNRRWQRLRDRYISEITDNPVWRYSRLPKPQDPDQGWKLHISATILTAVKIMENVAPFLANQNALYKAPVSLHELKKINSGVFYNYSQIGKFITIYPENDEQSVYFAEQLHQLTCLIPAPTIPYDLKFKPGSCVYYRYGAFKTKEIKHPDGTSILAMQDPQGNLVPDFRRSEKTFPDWVTNPFTPEPEIITPQDSPLKREFKIFRALSQRGKGGVYQGFDLRTDKPQFCVIKEGRENGETDWDGNDGFRRVQNEEKALKALRSAGVEVPEVYSSFTAKNNYYLVTEHLDGETLHLFLKKRKKHLSFYQALKYAIQLSEILSKIHHAGWVWRDCKPDNLILSKKHGLRAIDFEGACPIEQPDPFLWSTLVVKSLSWYEKNSTQSPTTADIFALGSILYLLFEGELPVVTENSIPAISRRGVSPEISRLVAQLLDPNTAKCFEAKDIAVELRRIQKLSKNPKIEPRLNSFRLF